MATEEKKRKMRKWNFPRTTLKRALDVATAIQKKNNGNPISPFNLANALNMSMSSSSFRYVIRSSSQYGLTEGTFKSSQIKLTSLGKSITKPRNAMEKTAGIQKAAQNPETFQKVYNHYSGGKIPEIDEFFKNVLETDFEVDPSLTDRFIKTLTENATYAKIFREQKGSLYVILDAPDVEEIVEIDSDDEEEIEEEYEEREPEPLKERKIFLAHGKNKIPLEQLKKILSQFDVPYTVAIDEPHSGRPISEKVAELMRECSSAIFIFTADEACVLKDGSLTYRPSDNVVYELGAASILYGASIVIFKEEAVEFASDFSSLGYITFEENKLEAKAMDLVKELIGFKLLKISVA